MDDLLDLNFSSPTERPLTASRPTSTKPGGSAGSTYAFDVLAKPSTSANYYSSSASSSTAHLPGLNRTSTPLTAPIPQAARLGGPPRPTSGLSERPTSSASAGRATASGGAKPPTDAFSSLLSLGPSSSANNGPESMAERATRLEREKREKAERERTQFDHGDFWSKYGEGSGSTSRPVHGNAVSQPVGSGSGRGDFNGFDDLLGSSTSPPSSKRPPNILAPKPSVVSAAANKSSMGSFWDNELLAPQPKPASSVLQSTATTPRSSSSLSQAAVPSKPDPFDFDQLDTGVSYANGANSSRLPLSSRRWDAAEDDMLGDLTKPVPRSPAEPSTGKRQTSAPGNSTRPASPPPHIVGQIVEMGFSPAQARAALAKTPSGLDVQAALEALLNSGSGDPSAGSRARDLERDLRDEEDDDDEEEEDFIQRERERRDEAERERRRARRAGPSRDQVAPRLRDDHPTKSAEASGRGTPDYSEQAEKYLAQASEIGNSVLGKASSLWAASKEKAQKLYEEQRKAYEAQQARAGRDVGEASSRPGEMRNGRDGPTIRDGRPKWMIDDHAGEADGEEKEEQSGTGGFKDDDDSPPRPRRTVNRDEIRNVTSGSVSRTEETYRSVKERTDLLFADEVKPYVPATRRRPPASSAPPLSISDASQKSTRPVTPPPLVQRALVEATPAQISRAATHKAKGNEHFKLGRFAESESAYAIAISSLPPGHLHLIALHNNRAASRLKLGQSDGVVEDCGTVLEIIGPSYHPSKEASLPAEYADVKLAESLVKASIKRAQAYEMGEKWKKALEDWERIMSLDSAFTGAGQGAAGTRNMAAEGARRARRMLDGSNDASASSVTQKANANGNAWAPPKGKSNKPPTTSRSIPSKPSTAVSDLRQANALAEAEDVERLRLKDTVEARLSSWKAGKETNLRALIASLDTVLWAEMMAGGLKVGMHELISEKQVKVRYMKVIARLHPDKLDVKKTTVEQRMLANGAFGTLNEAWQAFQNGS